MKRIQYTFWALWLAAICTRVVFAQQPRLFQIDGWHGNFRFLYEKENRFDPDLIAGTEFQEKLSLRNFGYIITPRFLSFQWDGSLFLLQERLVDPVFDRDGRSRYFNHSLTLNLFRKSPHSLTTIYSRGNNFKRLEFSGINKYRIENLQATLDLPALYLSSRIYASRRSIDDIWSRGDFTTHRVEKRTDIRYNGYRDRDGMLIRFNYEYNNTYNRIYSERSYSYHNGNLNINRVFGSEEQHKSETRLQILARRGFIEFQNASLQQTLELQHFPWLSSTWRYSFSAQRSSSFRTVQNGGSAALHYSLYKSLNASLNTSGFYGNSTGGDYLHRAVGGRLAYSKRLPLSGQLQISLSRNLALTHRETQSEEQQVVNERHIIIGGLPFFLNERNILPETIVIYDEDSKVMFEEGPERDYFIEVIGDRVRIHINPLGRIKEDDVLLVSYQFQTIPTVRYTTDARGFSASLAFGPFSIYKFVNDHDINVKRGDPLSRELLGDLYLETRGARFGFRKERLGLLVMYEERDQESRQLTYESANLRTTLSLVPAKNLAFSGSFEYYSFDNLMDSVTTVIYYLKSGIRWRPTGDLTLQLFGNFRIRDQEGLDPERIFELGGYIQRQWPIMWVKISYERRQWDYGPRFVDDRWFRVELFRKI